MRVILISSSNSFLPHFPQLKLSHFWGANSTKYIYIRYPGVRNFSNSFMPIFFKLYMCFCHGRKLCIWFGYNPQIKFCHSFRILNVVIFQSCLLLKYMDNGYLVCAIPPAVLCQSCSNCTGVFIMVWRYACGLDIIIRSISFCIDISFNLTNYKVGVHKFTDFASYCLIITEKKSQYVPPPVNNSTTKMALTQEHAALRSHGFRTIA